MPLTESLKTLSHHAYCLVGGDSIHSELISILEKKHSIQIRGNPDLFDKKFESLTIDDVREIKSIHETKPVSIESKKVFIITASAITIEAQNALLKILEEPAEYAIFFLIVPSAHILLPTVKSRLSLIGDGGNSRGAESIEDIEISKMAEKFYNSSPAKRLEIVKALIEDISKDPTSPLDKNSGLRRARKTKQDALNFLDAVQSVVYKKRGMKDGVSSLEAIETARKYVGDRAPSLKMLLEYVALNVL